MVLRIWLKYLLLSPPWKGWDAIVVVVMLAAVDQHSYNPGGYSDAAWTGCSDEVQTISCSDIS